MCVFILDVAPENLRGELTKWVLEVKAGVFVGKISKPVRERLWKKICETFLSGALMIYSNNLIEQGFCIEMFGEPNRKVIDLDGIQLIQRIKKGL